MAEGFIPIARCKEGDISLISANYANQLIDLLNALGKATISPVANVGTIKGGLTGFIWDFTQFDSRLKAIEQLTFINGSPNLSTRIAALEANDVYLNGRMNNANISGSGTCSGNNITINVSLNI